MSTQTTNLRAAIEELETVEDGHVISWEATDSFGNHSRQFRIAAADFLPSFAVGSRITITAGYDQSRVTLMAGQIDETEILATDDGVRVALNGRDEGARKALAVRFSRTWLSIPPRARPTAHQIIRDAAAVVGLSIGSLALPDYPVTAEFVVQKQTILELISILSEPFNLFASIQHVVQIRGTVLSIVRVAWAAPPAGGAVVARRYFGTRSLRQTLYLDSPRLTEFNGFVVRGATYVLPRTELGITVTVTHERSTAMQAVAHLTNDQVEKPADANPDPPADAQPANLIEIVTETVITETRYGDKVLSRIEVIYINNELNSRTEDRNWYYEPAPIATDSDPNSIQTDVSGLTNSNLAPSESALLRATHTTRYGLKSVSVTDPDTHVTTTELVFTELLRSNKQFYYNGQHEIHLEQEWTTELEDTPTGPEWGYTKYESRSHSQFTSGTTRTQVLQFGFESSKFVLSAAAAQHVGGGLPRMNEVGSRANLTVAQAQAPQFSFDNHGVPTVFTEERVVWSYDNQYLDQTRCDEVYQLVLDEQALQAAGYKWEEITLEGILTPNLWPGLPLSIEVDDAEFKDYWCESVTHSFTADSARTSLTAKRLTLETLG